MTAVVLALTPLPRAARLLDSGFTGFCSWRSLFLGRSAGRTTVASSLRSMRALASHSRTRLSSWRRVTGLLSTAPCRARRSRKKAFSSCTSASSQGMPPGRTLAHTALCIPVLTSPNAMALTLMLTQVHPTEQLEP